MTAPGRAKRKRARESTAIENLEVFLWKRYPRKKPSIVRHDAPAKAYNRLRAMLPEDLRNATRHVSKEKDLDTNTAKGMRTRRKARTNVPTIIKGLVFFR
jgi:hypothetical protein